MRGATIVTTWFLEQTDPADVRPARLPADDVTVTRAEVPSPELSRYLYTAVGGDWYWLDRLPWTWQQWYDWLDRPGVETWLAAVRGTPAGYLELEAQPEGEVEITYFGLLPSFVGQGVGGHLLTVALRQAWSLAERWRGATPAVHPTKRVWVHTCTLDGPAALPNYQARGMRLYRTDRDPEMLPGRSPGPWPGAQRSLLTR
jgi:GNAT superfamily N-acetyltransferase